MKKAYYIDTFSTQYLHEMYNAASLKMFSYMYENIVYYTSRSSLNHVQELFKDGIPPNVSVVVLPTIHSYGKFASIKRLLKQIQATITNALLLIWAQTDTDIIFNYNTAVSLHIINYIAKHKSNNKILQVCHGEMQDLVEKRHTSRLFKWGMSLFTNKNMKIADSLWFAVLGDSIRNNLKEILTPQTFEKMLSFDHTAIFNKIPLVDHKSSNQLVIGVVGGLRASKGLESLMSLGEKFKRNCNVEIRAIGSLSGMRDELKNSGIVITEGISDRFLSRQEMYDHIRQLDYALFLFPQEGYKFTASGSVFDAIDCERPILSLRNDYFDGLFNICGDFGYLEDTLESLVSRIEWLSEHKLEVSWNVKAVKAKLQPESAALRFGKQWNK